MGNVMAATPVAGPTSPVVPPPVFMDEKPAPPTEPETISRNPGTVEDLHKKCKDVFPMPFEGARICVNKGLSNHFQISHTLTMGSMSPSGYRFGATYVGNRVLGPGEAFPVLLADIDPSGNLNTNILGAIGDRTKTKFVAQIQESQMVNNQFTADYRGDSYTASLTLASLDLVNRSGAAVGHYLQSVTRSFDLGSEIAYQQGPNVPGGGIAAVSALGRYTAGDNVISGTIAPHRINFCYYHRGIENMQVGVEVESDFRSKESTATFGYNVDVPKANMSFKGSVDSNWQVSAVMEKRLMPLPFTFMLSGHMVHGSPKGNFKLGCGLILG